MSDDDRADRLRNRRKQAHETGERSETSESPNSSEPSKTSETSETSEQEETGKTDKQSVTDELKGTYMYLPESLKKEIDRYYGKLSGDYEYEYDEEFEKNRHYYRLLVEHGFDTVRDADLEEVRAMVDDL